MGFLGRFRRRPRHDYESDLHGEVERWHREQLARVQAMRAAAASVVAARARLEMLMRNLEQAGGHDADLVDIRRDRDELLAREQELRDDAVKLDAAIRSYRAKLERMRAQHLVAHARASVRETAAKVEGELTELSLAVRRAQDAVDRAQGHAAAVDEVFKQRSGPPERPASADEP